LPALSLEKVLQIMSETPEDLAYYMPPEWYAHDAVWLSWPYDVVSFPNLDQAEIAFAEFISLLHTTERIELIVLDSEMEEYVRKLLSDRKVNFSNIQFHHINYADIWIRDYGPIFVINEKLKKIAITKWIFNSWGNKYPELLKDNDVTYSINKKLNLQLFETGIVLEGGSIDVNGKGTVLTTQGCLLNSNRNPNLSKQEIETYLFKYLGLNNFIWLNQGIASDDTDGHVDDIARFVNANTILCGYQNNASSPDYQVLKENYNILLDAKSENGESFQIIKLPMPYSGQEAKRLPASYSNFYIGNKVVMVPTFNTINDKPAIEIIQSVFPNHQVLGLNATSLVYGCGTFHCMTQQQPAVI